MRSDTDIRREVIHELTWRPSLRDQSIAVTVKDGVVTLTGTVPTYTKKYQAEHAAESVPGVRGMAGDLDVRLLRRVKRKDPDSVLHRLTR